MALKYIKTKNKQAIISQIQKEDDTITKIDVEKIQESPVATDKLWADQDYSTRGQLTVAFADN